MLTIFIRAVILYTILVVLMRWMGKRQIGQLQPFELVITMLIADLVSVPMDNSGVPIFYGILPLLALATMHSIMTIGLMKNQRFRELLSGKPVVLIENGVIQMQNMKDAGVDIGDLLSELRVQGVPLPSQVKSALLETTGKISVVMEGLPLVLILDGEVNRDGLSKGGLSQKWLDAQLEEARMAGAELVLLALLDENGNVHIQSKSVGSIPLIFPAKEVADG